MVRSNHLQVSLMMGKHQIETRALITWLRMLRGQTLNMHSISTENKGRKINHKFPSLTQHSGFLTNES